jgi:hypothetical protein
MALKVKKIKHGIKAGLRIASLVTLKDELLSVGTSATSNELSQIMYKSAPAHSQV